MNAFSRVPPESAIAPIRTTVVKVGGSLLQDLTDLERIAQALTERRQTGTALLVVASALKGVTDLLERAALEALDTSQTALPPTFVEIQGRHRALAVNLDCDEPTHQQLESVLQETEQILTQVRLDEEFSDAMYCRLLSSGERLSVLLLAAAIRRAGQSARAITSEELGLRATGPARCGHCDLAASHDAFGWLQAAIVQEIHVLTGFYGIDAGGETILFGRGGSDDTACAVAVGLGAGRLELWKDVQGFMSADPKKVSGAHLVPELSFDEVAQLGAYGSSIVHHGCLEPLRGHPTEIVICSVNGVIAPGTRLFEAVSRKPPQVIALTASKGRVDLRLPDTALNAGRVLAALREHGITVKSLRSQPHLECVVPAAEGVRAVEVLRRLAGGQIVMAQHYPALVAAVGDGVASDPEVCSRMRQSLDRLGVDGDLVPRPAGATGLSFHLPQETLLPALLDLHECFFTASSTPGRG